MSKRRTKKNYPKTFGFGLDPPPFLDNVRKEAAFFLDYFPKSKASIFATKKDKYNFFLNFFISSLKVILYARYYWISIYRAKNLDQSEEGDLRFALHVCSPGCIPNYWGSSDDPYMSPPFVE